MPKTVIINNQIIIAKTREDVVGEYDPEILRLFNRWQESIVLLEDQQDKINEAKNDYKAMLLKRNEEIRYNSDLLVQGGVVNV